MVQNAFRAWRILAAGVAVTSVLSPGVTRAATLGELFPAGGATCFAAQYDGKHLDRHPRQRIAGVRLSTAADSSPAGQPVDLLLLDLDIVLRGNAKRQKTVGVICLKQADETWRCNEHTCNGRTIELKAESGELVLDLHDRNGPVRPGTLTLRSACESQAVEMRTELKLGNADQVFRLKRASAETCR